MKPNYEFDQDVCIVIYNDAIDFEFCRKYRIIESNYLKKANFFVLDMKYVSFIDSAGIGELVGIFRNLNTRGKSMCLINLQKNLRKVLQISEIEHLFPIFDSLEEARVHLQF